MKSTWIKKKELRELDPFRNLSKIRKRPLREEWRELGDSRKSLIWLQMK